MREKRGYQKKHTEIERERKNNKNEEEACYITLRLQQWTMETLKYIYFN